MPLRSPICTVVGHVDHGKTSLLDKLRGTAVQAAEAGGISQSIGASLIPLKTIRKVCGSLLDSIKFSITVPGLLFIDTPGHAAFISLRKRGGALADIAVVVVDINEGFKPQTVEAIEILKANKTPFVVAANKLDMVSGWFSNTQLPILNNLQSQAVNVISDVERKHYELVASLHELDFEAERFDRVVDYTKQVAIVPVSAYTGEGIPELLMVLLGLTQKYLEQQLSLTTSGFAKGTVLEIKETTGFGKTIDVILYDGVLKVNDTIVVANLNKSIITKVRALLEPKHLMELRDKSKFKQVKQVVAATGVKIAAPNLDKALAGMPIRSCSPDKVDSVADEIRQDVSSILIDTDDCGVIVKADTIGSLEALILLLKEKEVPIAVALLGNVSKNDVARAVSSADKNPFMGVILGFNISVNEDARILAKNSEVPLIVHDVIYSTLDEYTLWKERKRKSMELNVIDQLIRPGKGRVMQGYVFRQSNPAVFGFEALVGQFNLKVPVMNAEGKRLAFVKALQQEKESVQVAKPGKPVSMSLDGITIGRQLKEGDVIYTDIQEDDFRKLKENRKLLSNEEVSLLKEIAEIKRKVNSLWGVG